jgi:hypothetical protein
MADAERKAAEAEKALRELIPVERQFLGSDDDLTQTSIASLASVYLDRGAWKDAEPLRVESVATNRRVRGPEHATTIRSPDRLAQVYGQQGRYKEAEAIRREVLTSVLRQRGPDHPGPAAALIVGGYERLKDVTASIPAYNRDTLTQAVQRVVDFYTAWNEPGQAAEWRAKIALQ